MQKYKVSFLLFISFFMRINTMEIANVYFPKELQKIIFYCVDTKSKKNLVLTCTSFLKVAQNFFIEHGSFDDFVNKLYLVPHQSKMFKSSFNTCKDEYKVSFINYCSFKGNTIENGKSRGLAKDNHTKKFINSCAFLKKEAFKEAEKEGYFSFCSLVQSFNKEHVKYYTDYCNAVCCMELLGRNSENKNERIFWLDGITLEDLVLKYEFIKQGIADIYEYFGEKKASQYLNKKIVINDEIIKKVINNKSCSALVFLSECMVKKEETTSDGIKKLSDFFYDASTDELRKLLAKSGYAGSLTSLYNKAIKNEDCERIRCFLEIMLERGDIEIMFKRGDSCNEIKITDIFKFKLDDMLPALLEAGFRVLAADINYYLTEDHIKKYVKVCCGLYEKAFWTKENSYCCLHKAVLLKNAELVQYLLECGADPNVISPSNGPKVIYYVFDNDAIFSLLKDKSPGVFEDQYWSIRTIGYFLKNNSENFENNVIEVMRNGTNIKISDQWLVEAIINNKNALFKYLFKREVLSNLQKKSFLDNACYVKNVDVMEFLLKKNVHKEASWPNKPILLGENKMEFLKLFFNYEVNVFVVCDDYQSILKLASDESIKKCYGIYQESLTEEQKEKLLSYVIQQERYDVVKYLLKNGVRQTGVKISSSSITRNGIVHTFYEIDGGYNKIENKELKFLLFKDLVAQNKNDNAVLRFLLKHAIEKRSVDMVNAVLAHYKDINSLGSCIIDSWHIEDKDIMEIFINHGFNIIHLIDGDRRSIARAWLNVLSAEILIKSLKIGGDVITSQQALLLLEDVLFLYRDEVIESALKIKIKALFDFIISLKKINIFDVLCGSALSLDKLSFLELIGDQAIIEYISSKTDLMYIQLQRLFDKAVSSNRCDVVSYLFKEKKVPLEVVKDLCSEDENMQQILKSCQEKLEQQNKLYKESIDEHIKTIQNNKIGDLFIVNKPVDGESSGSIFDSIKFLSGQLLDNPQNIYLREKIQEINVAWVDNIYDHCPDNVAIMKAMEALSKINNNLRALTDEEKEARNNLRKIIMDGQGFKSDQCGKYLESIYKIYNRVEADKQLKEDMLCALGKRVLECIHQVNKGVSVGDQGDFIVCSVNAVPSSGSTEEDLFFEMLKALVKIDNAKQGNRNLLAGYEDKKNKYIAEIKQKKTEKLAANNGDTVINNQNSSFGLSTIIDIVSSFFTQLFSFLQWLNPFRLVIG